MATQQTINRMKKPELLNLLKETIENINKINSSIEVFNEKETSIKDAYSKISGDDGFFLKIESATNEAEEKIKTIREIYNEIYEDDDEGESIKTQLDELVKTFNEDKKKIDDFKKSIWGYKKTNESGEQENIPGLFDNINSFHDKQKEKYDELYKQIEDELLSGATTVNLSKSFADKVREYRINSWLWSGLFIVLVASVVVYYGLVTFSTKEIKSVQDVFLHLSFRAPFLALAVWLGVFFGNRRAESKKLEESYKHKEVMARSFIGYKRTLEEIDDKDEVLLKKHMENLLKAVGKDSSAFLDSKGEKYPLWDFSRKEKNKTDQKQEE